MLVKALKRPRRFTIPLTVYLTPEDHKKLKARARARNQTESHCARLALRRGFQRAIPTTAESVALPEIETAITTLRSVRLKIRPHVDIGVNLDQAIGALNRAIANLKQCDADEIQ